MSFLRQDGRYDPFFEHWSTVDGGGSGTIALAVSDARIHGNFIATVAEP